MEEEVVKQLLLYDGYKPVFQITRAIHHISDIGVWSNISHLNALNV